MPNTPRLEGLLDLIFPPVCVGCRRVGSWVCRSCWKDVRWLNAYRCEICGARSAFSPCSACSDPTSELRSIVAVARFEGVAREAIHALKYENRHAISGFMGRIMGQVVVADEFDVVVHAALHRSRKRERGYDQAEMLASHLAASIGLPFLPGAVVRIRKTKQQVALGRDARRENLRGAFRVDRPMTGKSVLVVDDVYTTGSTVRALADALRAAGAARVAAAVFGFADPASLSI